MKQVIVVGSDKGEWPHLCRSAERFADTNGLADDERARLLIILEELLTNLVKFGYDTAAPGGRAQVELAIEGETLVIVFTDDGRAFDPLAHVVDGLDDEVEDRPIGGLGILLIRAFADEMRYAREGDCNCLTLARRLGRRPD